MRAPLVRFGVAIDAPLLADLDRLVAARGGTRSEMFRDLARAEIVRAKVVAGVDAVAALTIVYDHHVRDLSEKLTELQHQLGEGVRSAMHVHLSHDYCLEVIVIRGRSDKLQAVANTILALRGVKHGGIEIVADVDLEHPQVHSHVQAGPHDHAHEHRHGLGHGLGGQKHGHGHAPPPPGPARTRAGSSPGRRATGKPVSASGKPRSR